MPPHIDPTLLHGFRPKSRYAALFVQIYHLTKNNIPEEGELCSKDEEEEEEEAENEKWIMDLKLIDRETKHRSNNIVVENVKQSEKSDNIRTIDIDCIEIEEGEIDDEELPDLRSRIQDKIENASKLDDVELPDLRSEINKKKENTNKIRPIPKTNKMIKTKYMLAAQETSPGLVEQAKTKPYKLSCLTLPLSAQFSMDPSPVRVSWLHRLLSFMSGRGTPISNCPSQPILNFRKLDTNTKKLPLDLYRLYNAVQEEGGGSLCISNTKWRKVATHMELPIQTYNVLKKMFERFLMEFEKAEGGEKDGQDIVILKQMENLISKPVVPAVGFNARHEDNKSRKPPIRPYFFKAPGNPLILKRLGPKKTRFRW